MAKGNCKQENLYAMPKKWKAENLLTRWAEICNSDKVAAGRETSPLRLQIVQLKN